MSADPVIDLYAELLAAVGAVSPECRSAFAERGVWCRLVGRARVRPEGDGLYEPDPGGDSHAIFPVLAEAHVCTPGHVVPRNVLGLAVPVVDLAAWRQGGPVLLRRGAVAALGEWCIRPFMLDGPPLRLFETPRQWAAAEFAGAVILDWDALAPDLLCFPEIVCSSVDLAETAAKQLAKARRRSTPDMPKISVAVTEA